jgi:hypothetical protein
VVGFTNNWMENFKWSVLLSMIISLSEGILGSYLPTIPSFSEYFDSNAAETTDDGQTLSKTEVGQTVSTNHKAVTQSRAYLSNEFLGLGLGFPRVSKTVMEDRGFVWKIRLIDEDQEHPPSKISS